jgi:hypothetical protein
MLRNLLNDESGFLVSAELVLIFTLAFCAVVVGVATVRDALVNELGDTAEAIGALNQSYNVTGLQALISDGGTPLDATDDTLHASCSGSGFNDLEDDCDCDGIDITPVDGKNFGSTLNDEDGT